MTITVCVSGVEYSCTLQHPGAQQVLVQGLPACPHCSGWPALLVDGSVVALAKSEAGLAQAIHDAPKSATIQAPYAPERWWLGMVARNQIHPATRAFRVRLPNYAQGHDAYTGNAVCTRCGLVVGTMRVQVDTLFGIAEDHAVLEGRARTY